MRCKNLHNHRCTLGIQIPCCTDATICGYMNTKERPTELYQAFPEWILEEDK